MTPTNPACRSRNPVLRENAIEAKAPATASMYFVNTHTPATPAVMNVYLSMGTQSKHHDT